MSQELEAAFDVSESEIRDNPLRIFDDLLEEARQQRASADERDRFKEAILVCLSHVGDWVVPDQDSVEESALRALDNYDELDRKAVVGACFLRLLPQRGASWVHEPPWRPRLARFFDSQFAHTLYQAADVDVNAQSHEKLDLIARTVKAHESRLEDALQALTSLQRMPDHRQKLMRVINNRLGQSIIQPFLPRNTGAELGELYTRVEAYLDQRDGLGVIDAHASLREGVRNLVDTLEAKGTVYARWLAERVAGKLESLLERDFADNRAVQPAKVSLEARDKKYPFHLVGQTVKIGLVVENHGPGYAYEAELFVTSSNSISLLSNEARIGRLAPSSAQLIEIDSEVQKEELAVSLLAHLAWRNLDGSQQESEFEFVVEAQKSDVDWDQLVRSGPYSLEPVITERELAGRTDVLNRLIGTARGASVGSSIIYGQKRVGKTSIARALWSYLRDLEDPNYLVVYLDDYIEESAGGTIKCLTTRICEELAHVDPGIGEVEALPAGQSLSPLADFLRAVTRRIQDARIVIVLDEFDELPLDLYAQGALANAFFLKLRSLSSEPRIGFVVVGGEKMTHIIECQGMHLNKWDTVEVDYFSRRTEWADYKELIQHPVGDSLEYTEGAFETLYCYTAGNPYFTKLLCGSIVDLAKDRRDCYITDLEVGQAVRLALGEREGRKKDFQHFWVDGIFVTGSKKRGKSIERRKVLIALSDVLEKESPAPKEMVVEHPIASGVVGVDSHLKEFVRRKVLTGDLVREVYDFKVPLFREWLKEHGVYKLIADFSDLDLALRERQEQERIKVKASEIVELVDKWPPYQGQPITEDRVRAWLAQFGGVRKQRLMFTILQGLRFYSNKFVREKMREVHGIIRRDLEWHRGGLQRVRRDILVSYLDAPAKSGSHFAQLYADESRISVENVVAKETLKDVLEEVEKTQALVFIDDLVGSGGSAEEYLRELDAEFGDLVRDQNIKVVFIAMVAYVEGWARVERAVENLRMSVEPHACEVLDKTARCFSEDSVVFPDAAERESARGIALEWGQRLEKNCPLGYGDLQLAVVFERRCPNNSLPILWSELGEPKWIPLFKRQ
jgi:hypothetical protein